MNIPRVVDDPRRVTNIVDFWYKAVVVRVVDGDTIDVLIRFDVGFRQVVEWTQRVRLARINAPERKRPTIDAGLAATEWLTARVPVGSVVWLATSKGDSFGRYIAEVYTDPTITDDSRAVNDELVAAGHAVYRSY